jgi:hypothetical protein
VKSGKMVVSQSWSALRQNSGPRIVTSPKNVVDLSSNNLINVLDRTVAPHNLLARVVLGSKEGLPPSETSTPPMQSSGRKVKMISANRNNSELCTYSGQPTTIYHDNQAIGLLKRVSIHVTKETVR